MQNMPFSCGIYGEKDRFRLSREGQRGGQKSRRPNRHLMRPRNTCPQVARIAPYAASRRPWYILRKNNESALGGEFRAPTAYQPTGKKSAGGGVQCQLTPIEICYQRKKKTNQFSRVLKEGHITKKAEKRREGPAAPAVSRRGAGGGGRVTSSPSFWSCRWLSAGKHRSTRQAPRKFRGP